MSSPSPCFYVHVVIIQDSNLYLMHVGIFWNHAICSQSEYNNHFRVHLGIRIQRELFTLNTHLFVAHKLKRRHSIQSLFIQGRLLSTLYTSVADILSYSLWSSNGAPCLRKKDTKNHPDENTPPCMKLMYRLCYQSKDGFYSNWKPRECFFETVTFKLILENW